MSVTGTISQADHEFFLSVCRAGVSGWKSFMSQMLGSAAQRQLCVREGGLVGEESERGWVSTVDVTRFRCGSFIVDVKSLI